MTSQTREQLRGWLAGLLAAALFGSSAPLIGSFSHGSSPVLVAGLLYAGAALVLLPLAMAFGAGNEILQPFPIVVLGGLITSTILTLLVLQAHYARFGGWLLPRIKPAVREA